MVDVQAIEQQHHENLPANKIFSMLEPYIQSQNSTGAEQQTGQEGMEIEVEY
jgi:hypothetical protein